jgi:hypothetical protein
MSHIFILTLLHMDYFSLMFILFTFEVIVVT